MTATDLPLGCALLRQAVSVPTRMASTLLALSLVTASCSEGETDAERAQPGSPGDVFHFSTELEVDRFNLAELDDEAEDPGPAVLSAVCRSYDDWLEDRILNPEVMILDAPAGLRSAELLGDGGEFFNDPVAQRAEQALFDAHEDVEQAISAMPDAERDHARDYFDARSLPPSEDAADRFVIYANSLTTTSLLVSRLEIAPEQQRRPRPPLTRTGLIPVALGPDHFIAVDESNCWE